MSSTERNTSRHSDDSSTSVVRRLAAVLDSFRARDVYLGVNEIARRTDLPKSTVSRLVKDMSELPDPEDLAGAPTGDARSTTLQVLLNVEELDELERVAAHRGLSKSAVAREAILRLVRAEEAPRSAEDRRLAQDWQIYP